jgi:membrane-bound lytic murein transglycosylase B
MRNLLALLLLAITLCSPAFADDTDVDADAFNSWLTQLRHDARDQGISQKTIDDALTDIAPIPDVIELDQKQPETTITLPEYLARIVSDKRVEQGRQLLQDNRELLDRVSKQYGVQPQYIVALWGIESNFGAHQGDYGIVESLATLAYDGRRADFFRGELLKALKILDEGDISLADMKGSWAGAMGQCQFMPSSFLNFAVDFDNDGKRDIWNDQADVFASIANYLHSSGWSNSVGWGSSADLPDNFDQSLADIKNSKSYSKWKRMGVNASVEGADDDTDTYVIMVGDGGDAMPFMITENYKVLLKWNRSRYFATAVGMLADQIKQ